MARAGWQALFAGGLTTPHVLLAVDDSASMVAQIGTACPLQRHAKSLHKTPWLEGKPSAEVGW